MGDFCLHMVCFGAIYEANILFVRDFTVHFTVTLKNWDNWHPGKDYGGTWDRRTKNRDILPKAGQVKVVHE